MRPAFALLLTTLLACHAPDKAGLESVQQQDSATSQESAADESDSGDSAAESGGDSSVPVDCSALDLPAGFAVDEEADCALPTMGTDPWSARLLWSATSPDDVPDANRVLSTPVVGYLYDSNGDGVANADDDPDVAAVFYGVSDGTDYFATVAVFDGATGEMVWDYGPDVFFAWEPLIADLNGDGQSELLVLKDDTTLVALEPGGDVLWTGPAGREAYRPNVADLDGDGIPEVILTDGVLNGATGAVEFNIDLSGLAPYRYESAVGDIDQDGVDQEIVANGQVLDSDGTVLWTSGEKSVVGLVPALVQADDDPEAEIVWVGDDLTIWDDDGTLRTRVPLGLYEPSTPCAGDLDGDGQMEIAFTDNDTLYAYELDGTEMWRVTEDDTSGAAGCTVWDVDGDGTDEVIFEGETLLTIYDGATGAVLLRWADRVSSTIDEMPVVADVDGDGEGEIVFGSDDDRGTTGIPALQVLANDGLGWGPAGKLWPNRNYSMSNWNDDGTIPAHPVAPWLDSGVYRGRGKAPSPVEPAAANLTVAIIDGCVASCDVGPIALSVQVQNTGTVNVRAAVSLAVFALDDAGSRFIKAVDLPSMPAGEALDAFEIDLSPGDVGTRGVEVVVDDDERGDGDIDECDETDNTATWDAVVCP